MPKLKEGGAWCFQHQGLGSGMDRKTTRKIPRGAEAGRDSRASKGQARSKRKGAGEVRQKDCGLSLLR